MMGHTHALSGCVAWLAAVPAFAAAGHPLAPADVVAGAVVCSGAALLPDLDHPHATIAHTFGPVTWLPSKIINVVAGGHRHATHSFFFVVLAGAGAQLVAGSSRGAREVFLFLMVGLALRALGLGVPRRRFASAVANVLATLGVLAMFATAHTGHGWFGIAVALGCLVHLVGDCLTTEGCPLLWPSPVRFSLPFAPSTDGRVERWVVTPLLAAAVLVLGARLLPVWSLLHR